MHKNATKCNNTQSKWCINKHGASKIIDTFETYQATRMLEERALCRSSSSGLCALWAPVSARQGKREGLVAEQCDPSPGPSTPGCEQPWGSLGRHMVPHLFPSDARGSCVQALGSASSGAVWVRAALSRVEAACSLPSHLRDRGSSRARRWGSQRHDA
jgi:hypothetical protein